MRTPFAWLAILALAVAACSPPAPPTKHEILSLAETARTKADLERALGAPDDRDKVGPLETWTYLASDGEVNFIITGDTVRLQTAD